jgi:hypothetical protein
MKKFAFPLDKVRTWRHTQVRLEEATLARLGMELQTLEHKVRSLADSVGEEGATLTQQQSATALEIAALEHYRSYAIQQGRKLLQAKHGVEQQIAQQKQVLLGRRRAAELLDQLRDQRHDEWTAAANKEIDQQAEESHTSRLLREMRAQ